MAAYCTLLMASCVEKGLEYGDIDTTVNGRVNNLVVPVNLENINLKTVLDIKEGSPIKEVDGRYAVVENGTFNSNSIYIRNIVVNKPNIEPITLPLTLQTAPTASAHAMTRAGSQPLARWTFGDVQTELNITAIDISEDVVSVQKVGAQYTLILTLSVNGMPTSVKAFYIDNLRLQLPRGLMGTASMGTYDSNTGILDISGVKVTNNMVSVNISGHAIDFEKAGITIQNHNINYNAHIKVVDGTLSLYSEDVEGMLTGMPENMNIRFAPTMSDVIINSLYGQIKYSIDGLNISDIDLSEVPQALKESGTDINLKNPQLYLQITNPLGNHNVYGTLGLEIGKKIDGVTKQTIALDNGTMQLSTGSNTVKYNYCLAPTKPESYYTGFEGAKDVRFSGLSSVLGGEKIPDALSVKVVNPQIPTQHVEGLELGKDLGEIQGKYTFYTPLELTANSVIAYSDTLDGWHTEDVDEIDIEMIKLNATATTDLPLQLTVQAIPIDVNGNQVAGVESVAVTLDANAKDQNITLMVKGKMNNIDGIIIKARATAQGNSKPLAPNEYIRLDNLKVTVSGYVTHKL